jgi:transmembrane sensor
MTRQDIRTLVEKFLNGKITAEESEQLNSWYRSENEKEVHWEVGSAGEAEDLRHRILGNIKGKTHPEKERSFQRTWLRMAASVSLVLLLGWFAFKLSDQRKREYVTVSSPVGKVTQIAFPDGSHAWLNAGSRLKYVKDFGTDRNVELEGEAFFDVKPDVENPFYVHSGVLLTKVLGTAFVVRAYPDEKWMNVAVEHGKVQVSKRDQQLALLLPEQQIRYHAESGKVVSSNFDMGSKFAWKEGKLEFNEQTLASITDQLEKWYQVKFTFSNEELRKCVYTASFDNSIKISDLLTVLCEVNDVRFELGKDGRTVKLTGKGCN